MTRINIPTITFSVFVAMVITTIFFIGCKKQNEWLDVKQRTSDVVPQTLYDFQAILDNTTKLTNSFASAGAVGTDDVYILDANLPSSPEPERNLYLWNKEVWTNNTSYDWNSYYTMLENANIVLDGLRKLNTNTSEFNDSKGQALFWRAISLYSLAQIFCKPFSTSASNLDLGIPVRVSSDVNIIYQRGSVQETYNQITQDLLEASTLLPSTAKYITRPVKAAALGLLARVYLNMEDYNKALLYSDLCIKEKGLLLDYNSGIVSTSLTYRFPANGVSNPEILFFAQGGGYTSVNLSALGTGFVSPELYDLYEEKDLRKTLFFVKEGGASFYKMRATYTGTGLPFAGVASNEAYLVRAESNARLQKTSEALLDLNFLLKNRYATGSFTPKVASTPDQALQMILLERRKELAFVGTLRWEDLRRLNKDIRFAKALTRVSAGITYTLPANSARYILPIPLNEVQISGIEQNER